MDTPRKASEVLVELENTINQLFSLVKAQDLNIKVLSNKLNMLMDIIKDNNVKVSSIPSPSPSFTPPASPPFSVSTAHSNMSNGMLQNRTQVEIKGNGEALPMTDKPQGFRRTSRPETLAVAEERSPRASVPSQKVSIQDPSPPNLQELAALDQFAPFENMNEPTSTTKVAVSQRVVDKNGKSIFLAEVDIWDSKNNSIFKTRTNGVGKWMASLPVGNYKVLINKRESVTKQKIESTQSISIDGAVSQVSLDVLYIK